MKTPGMSSVENSHFIMYLSLLLNRHSHHTIGNILNTSFRNSVVIFALTAQFTKPAAGSLPYKMASLPGCAWRIPIDIFLELPVTKEPAAW